MKHPIEILAPDAATGNAIAGALAKHGYASEVVTPAPKSPYRENVTLPVTLAAMGKLLELDKTLVGTDDYMGLAYFWAYEYRHDLRDVSNERRVEVHNALRAAGLSLDGESAQHTAIIRRK